jgi:hypothetical protein
MACYISSRNNRFYAAVEGSYGVVAPVGAAQRFNAVHLRAAQNTERPARKDKLGTRTYQGLAGTLKRTTVFSLKTYLYARALASDAPRYGALMQAALGASPRTYAGGVGLGTVSGADVTFAAEHGLSVGDAVSINGDLRFVITVPGATEVGLSAPLTSTTSTSDITSGAVTYAPAKELPSASIYDYWTPTDAVQRILRGAAVNTMKLHLCGDFHELTFEGQAADVIDSKSFTSGQGGLDAFPAEPTVAMLTDSPVPGHLGQAWIGTGPDQLFTLSDAVVKVKNNVDFRRKDLGSLEPRCLVAGNREVTVDLELYGRNAGLYDEIYQAARYEAPIPLMLQMGETAGAMCAIYLPSFIPSVPQFMDDEERMQWKLAGSVAVGTEEDEIYVAFG